ncbi:MAG: ankyrin repeat domain-containing protein [Candidatus Aminicenantales bacterium]
MKIEDIVSTMTAGLFLLLTALICAGCRDDRPLVYATIQEAAAKGDLADIKRHVQRGADVNNKDYQGSTPLYIAIALDQNKVAEYLIARGADVNKKNVNSWTALHCAVAKGDKYQVKLLLDMSADVNIRGGDLNPTPLILATYQGDKDMALLLISHGADVNAGLDFSGDEPLHIASSRGDMDMAILLISHGAKVNAPNNFNLTPCQKANSNQHTDIVELLKKNGAIFCEDRH